jgi:glutaminyl-peptide cyclotransferase
MRISVRLAALAVLRCAAALTELSDDDLRNIPSPGDDFDIDSGKLLAPILIPRVSGTEGAAKTQQHFVDFFTTNLPDWEMVWQNSTSKTPVHGDRQVPFANLVFRRDPPWARTGDVGRLTLVAHYDSKYTPKDFIGATDSAAPCAMLLHAARAIDEALTAKWAAAQESGDDLLEDAVGVQVILLDGEEAFLQWTDDDSLYGSRSLAEHWETRDHPSMATYRNDLDSISLFVLLDLLGAADPSIPSYFSMTHWAYTNMAKLEQRMRDLGLLESRPKRGNFFPDAKKDKVFSNGFVSDDHVPFMKRGVEILHIIPTPFPDVWHKMEDDGAHLDMPTTRDWARIVTAFAVEWMDIKDHMPKKAVAGSKRSETSETKSMKTEL